MKNIKINKKIAALVLAGSVVLCGGAKKVAAHDYEESYVNGQRVYTIGTESKTVQTGTGLLGVDYAESKEQVQVGTRTEQIQVGTKTVQHQVGTKKDVKQVDVDIKKIQVGTRREKVIETVPEYQIVTNYNLELDENGKCVTKKHQSMVQIGTKKVEQILECPVYQSISVPKYAQVTTPVYETVTEPVYQMRIIPVYEAKTIPAHTEMTTVPVYEDKEIPKYVNADYVDWTIDTYTHSKTR